MRRKTWLLGLVGAAFALLVGATSAQAEVIAATQTTDITIPSSGEGSPYPSNLQLEGADGNMTDVNIAVTLSHTFPGDVDIAVVSPDGDSEILMSDACGGGDLVSVSFNFDSEAGSPLPSESCSGGTFQPTNLGGADTWPAPGPGAITTSQLNSFNGEDPNGVWKLFVVDDAAGETGTVLQWSVIATTETAEVVVPAAGTSGIANPYPSTKTFATPAGKVISDVNFSTPDFNHMHPDDVDMLLAGPRAGATALLMSDACGSDDIHDYSWTFDDEAPALMTDSEIAGCNPFTIKPSNFGITDTFPAPAPPAPFGSTLSVFDGMEGGSWSLFVNDDAGGDTGFLTSWTLNLTTRDAADTGFAASALRVEEGGIAQLVVTRKGPASLGPATLSVGTSGAAVSGTDFTAPPALLQFAAGEASKTIAIPIAADAVGEALESFKVVLSNPRDDARLTGLTTADVTIGPDNEFGFGKAKRNLKKGTAKLLVSVPGPGDVVLGGKKIKAASAKAAAAGTVALTVKAMGKGLKKLKEAGSVKLTAQVTFTPTGGAALTQPKKIKLVRKKG